MELPTFEWKVGEEPELTMCREWVAIRFAKAVPLELVILSPQRVCLAFVSLPKRSGILWRLQWVKRYVSMGLSTGRLMSR